MSLHSLIPRARGLAVSLLVTAASLFGVASFALAAEPGIETNGPARAWIELWGIRSTRIGVDATVLPDGSSTDWSLEMSATSKSGPWVVLASGTVASSSGGLNDAAEQRVFDHLTPSTTYYLRLVATNSSGVTTTTDIVDRTDPAHPDKLLEHLTTLPAGAPEVAPPLGSFVEGVTPYPNDNDENIVCHAQQTSAHCGARIWTNGAEAEYHFEYATSANGPYSPFTSGADGTVTVAEDFAGPEAQLTGLSPETTYYVRLKAANKFGAVSVVKSFDSRPARPTSVSNPAVSNITATSVHLAASFQPNSFETEYRIEYTAEPENPLSWAVAPGGSGTIPAAEATEEYRRATADLTGLDPGTPYYVRLFAKNEHGTVNSTELGDPGRFETYGSPSVYTFPTHALDGEDVRLLGAASPGGLATDEEQAISFSGGGTGGTFTLTFDGETTAPILFHPTHDEANQDGEAATIERALRSLPEIGESNVTVSEDFLSQTYTVEFRGPLGGRDLPQITADATGLTPTGAISVATVNNGAPFASRYHFEYTTGDFADCATPANTGCLATPEVELGAGNGDIEARSVGADLSGLQPGQSYRYRIVATNSTPGSPVVDGGEQALTGPTPAPAAEGSVCSNQALRAGASAALPDCRAYEQVTPSEKGGAQDISKYGHITESMAVGADGEHAMLTAPGVQWGSSVDPVRSTYLFSRTPQGWQTISARPPSEPEGISYVQPALTSADLTQAGFADVGWESSFEHQSAQVEVRIGPPGGPYTTIATGPRTQLGETSHQGLVAASADSSKYVIQTEDHRLLGHATGTTAGYDLYEYADGELRQVNVDSGGKKISACGARIVQGRAEERGTESSVDAVSADGSRVFFTDDCTGHLYVRVDGAETVDIGEYDFLAADPRGAEVLLDKRSGADRETHEVFLYDAEGATARPLFAAHGDISATISEDFTTIYLAAHDRLTPEAPPSSAGSDLYAYDIPAAALHFLFQGGEPKYVSRSGRYLYFEADGIGGDPRAKSQVYRYDNGEHAVQCISCASSFAAEPKRPSTFNPKGWSANRSGGAVISANGDYAFFQTSAALVPNDIDGEEEGVGLERENPSQDVYEWRADGVGGCSHLQGCLALISSGRGGYKNELLGAAEEGRDVFFTTHEALASSDQDTAGDIYDARIGGGFSPPPPHPVECQGDACQSPLAAPIDTTPASLSFSGPGNPSPLAAPAPKGKAAKPKAKKAKKKAKAGAKTRKAKKKTKQKAKQSDHRRAR